MEERPLDVAECSVRVFFERAGGWSCYECLCFRVMLFIVGLPVTQIILFAISIGHDPKGLPISVKNYEINGSVGGCPIIPGCNGTILSCRYLKYLEKRDMVLVRCFFFLLIYLFIYLYRYFSIYLFIYLRSY